MTVNFAIALMMVFVAGIGIAIQAPVNSALGTHLNSGLFAALVSFGVGFSTLLVLNLAYSNFAPIRALPSAPAWMFAGGLLGTFAVYSSLTNVAKLGSLTMVATLVFGQLLAALVIDAIGFGNLQVSDISPARVLAVVLIGVGIVLSRF